MLFDDDQEPRAQKKAPRDLTKMSIEDLGAYIQDLRAEIERAETMVTAKQAHLANASTLFKR